MVNFWIKDKLYAVPEEVRDHIAGLDAEFQLFVTVYNAANRKVSGFGKRSRFFCGPARDSSSELGGYRVLIEQFLKVRKGDK